MKQLTRQEKRVEEQSKEPLPTKTTGKCTAGSGGGWGLSAAQKHIAKEDLKWRGEGWEIITTGAVAAEAPQDSGKQAHAPRVTAGYRVQLPLPPPACF